MKKTIAILFGAVSSEYEVSLRSSASVLRNIPRDIYDIVMLGITRDGRWLEYTGEIDDIESDMWHKNGHTTPALLSPDRSHGGMLRLLPDGSTEAKSIDAVFPVMHGEHAEDGTIQGLAELAGIPCVGCGVLASSSCMDKEVTHILLESVGIKTAPWVTILRPQLPQLSTLEPMLREKLRYPMFVKPANTGSSVGISKAKNAQELAVALEEAFRYDRKVLVETAIVGAEVECAVLGNYTDSIASVVGEIVPRHEFYDYEGKYLDDSTELYIPARLPQPVTAKIRQLAVQAFVMMGGTGLARVDFFARADGSVVLNEINTLPGFTSISMYPKLIEASGISYSDLIDRLIRLALEKEPLCTGQAKRTAKN